jgi:signal transduction histidine kinase
MSDFGTDIQPKAKPYRLYKYFTYTSLVVIFLGTIALFILNTHWAKDMQNEKREEYALLLVENLNHQIFTQFIIPVALKFGEIQLRNQDQYERLDKVIRTTLHSFKVEQVNIYDKTNIISYSFDRELMGKGDVGGTAYKEALFGNSSSKIIQRGSFWEIALGIPKDIKIITVAPLRAEKPLSRLEGPVLGVIEIVQDLSQDYQGIFNFQVLVITSSTLIMSVLFLILIFIVKRGEAIMERRAQERLELKEQLSRAERLSSLGEMAAGISHEIRNPLGIIRSSAELLKKKVHAVDPDNSIPDIIVQESTRLNNIITDFINYARPRSPQLVACRIEEIIEKNATFLAAQADKQGHLIKRRFEPDLPVIRADGDMLYQAFLNILINAMQAMETGGTIYVNVQASDSRVQIAFEDEGPGIPDALLDKIWDPFFTTKDIGTGLGLGIVKNIIESHGGTITISRRDAGGSRVNVELPIDQEASNGDDFNRRR